MARNLAKLSFTRGEITPLAHARRDIELYQAAARALYNFVVIKEGGVRRRSGTRYRGDIKYDNKDTRLIDFVFSSAQYQSYAIELGDLYTRFWTDGGQIQYLGSPYEVAAPYAEGELRNIKWLQSFDTIYFSLQSYTKTPKKLVRAGHTSWSWSDVAFWDGPYLPINDTDTKITPSASPVTGATITCTFGSTIGVNNDLGLQGTDVGRHIRLQVSGGWSWGRITAVASTTACTVSIVEGTASGTTATASWRLGAFSGTTGYPGALGWYQGRIFYASTPDNPRGIWFSRSGYPEDFTPSDYDGTVTEDHGGYISLLGKGDAILWLQEGPRLQVGTTGAVRTVGASNTSNAFGPRNVAQQVEASGGVSKIDPVTVGVSTIHTPRFSKALEDLYYDYNSNSVVTPRMSNLSEHMFDSGVTELWYQQEPSSIMWSVLGDGTIVATTLDKYEKVTGFSRHDVGGDVISMSCIPGQTGDDLYMVVRRTINDVQQQYMETLTERFLRMEKEDAWFVDCGGQYVGAATNTVSGATWLANTEVDVLADGAVLPRRTISSGGVLTLPTGVTAEKITFGIPIDAHFETLEPPIDTPEGSNKGNKMRVVGAVIDVYETQGLKVVSDRGQEDYISFRSPDTPYDASPPLVTGQFRLLVDGSWSSNGVLRFEATEPLPATIRGLNVKLDFEP